MTKQISERAKRQATVVDQEKINSLTVGLRGDDYLIDFLLCILRGLDVKKIEHEGESKNGFLHILQKDPLVLAEEMHFLQKYERIITTKDLCISTQENGSWNYHSPESPIAAGVLAGLIGKNIINYVEGKPLTKETCPLITHKKANYSGLVIGAGATGNFVGLQASLSGFCRVDIMDADIVETSNLNRQILHYDAIGKNKAESLSEKISRFRVQTQAYQKFFTGEVPKKYDVIFSCVDNAPTRRDLDACAEREGFLLVDGGTTAYSGRVSSYCKGINAPLSKKLDLTGEKKHRCAEKEASIIMPNMIIGSLMVDEALHVLAGQSPRNIFYDSYANEVTFGTG